jgi:hypothetical protein
LGISEEETRPEEEAPEELSGAFMDSLTRTNKKIRRDRAEAIAEDAEMTFKRTIEDMERDMKRMKREREYMLDLSPENAQSLMLGKDFDADKFVKLDLKYGTDMHNLQIKLDIARRRYARLFTGGE